MRKLKTIEVSPDGLTAQMGPSLLGVEVVRRLEALGKRTG
jgi:hypothetical protein